MSGERTVERRVGDPVWRVVALASIATALLVAFASYFKSPPPGLPPGMPPGARGLPRIPMPPHTIGEWLRTLGVGSIVWYASILSTPLLLRVRQVLRERHVRTSPAVAIMILLVFIIALGEASAQYLVTYGGASMAPPFRDYAGFGVMTALVPMLGVAALVEAIDAGTRAQARELETQRMARRLAEARLEALSAQLQPHFLFNTLQAISSLISVDPVAADEMLDNLSEVLRELLAHSDRALVPLSEELRTLAPYLAIVRRRFGGRIALTVDVPDEMGTVAVPFFLLQPLVENALQHGPGRSSSPGAVTIAAERSAGALRLIVSDTGSHGVGASTRHRPGRQGMGLANLRARLTELFGDDAELVTYHSDDGFKVVVTLPDAMAPPS